MTLFVGKELSVFVWWYTWQKIPPVKKSVKNQHVALLFHDIFTSFQIELLVSYLSLPLIKVFLLSFPRYTTELRGLDVLLGLRASPVASKVIFLLWTNQKGIVPVRPNESSPAPPPSVLYWLNSFIHIMKTIRKLGFAMNHLQNASLLFGSWYYYLP